MFTTAEAGVYGAGVGAVAALLPTRQGDLGRDIFGLLVAVAAIGAASLVVASGGSKPAATLASGALGSLAGALVVTALSPSTPAPSSGSSS